jgi:type I restriction enzyme S subunit
LFPGLQQLAVTAVDVMVWRTDGEIADAEWFVHWINSPGIRAAMTAGAGGTTRQRIAGGRIKELELPVPPIAEQRRIVAKLDALAARIARARSELDRIPTVAKHLRSASVSSLRDQVADAPLLEVGKLAKTFDGPFGSNLKSEDYTTTGVRVVRLENIGHLRFIAEKETFISTQKYEVLKRHTLEANDVLFSSFVDQEVRVCQFPGGTVQTINKADCFAVRVDADKCDPRFIMYMLASPATYRVIKKNTHGATRPRIGLTQLREFSVNVPSRHEQCHIVTLLDRIFARAERIKTDAAQARMLLDRLEAAILAKAFRGELVPQDPNDEPASVLLERIRAQRAIASKPKRGRQKGAPAPSSLGADDSLAFAEALVHPKEPNARLKAAARRYVKSTGV